MYPIKLVGGSWTPRMMAALGDPVSSMELEGFCSYPTAAEPTLRGSSLSPGSSRARNVTLGPEGLISNASQKQRHLPAINQSSYL